jgi:ATPase family associated with various cellular activities (AAA)
MRAEDSTSDQEVRRLADIKITPSNHVDMCLHVAAFMLIDQVRMLDPDGDLRTVIDRFPFAAQYLDGVLPFLPSGLTWEDARAFWDTAIEEWERDHCSALPICRLRAALGIGRGVITAMLLSALAEDDSRFGHMWAYLNGGVARRPTFETLAATMGLRASADPWNELLRAVELGLLTVLDDTGPRSEWILATSREVWDVVRGHWPATIRHEPASSLPSFDELVLSPMTAARCRRIADRWSELDLVVVRGSAGSDRLAVVGAIAREAGCGVVRTEVVDGPPWQRVGAIAAALGAVPVVEVDLAPGETATVPRPAALAGPLVVVAGSTGGIDRRGHERAVMIEVPLLDHGERVRRWSRAFAGAPVDDVEGIARAFRLQGSHIERIARSAVALAAIDGEPTVRHKHVRTAADELHRQLLDSLATKLEVAGYWNDVVVGDFTALKFAELEARCRHRDSLSASLGAAYGVGTGVGVRALFTGGSGTGKTLAARVLGNQLGLDVYRVDLAAIVNKYVGETEKNLHRILTTAEELDVVLLIDEGDSLLGRRTEVRTANDRFANLETNFLLQRLENYRGIVVITTNAADHIDPAFQRRMDVVVSFLSPTARERAEIWRLHLPENHQVPESLLIELSHRCAMTGGQIRNAVLHAVLISLGVQRPVSAVHLEQAVASEYQKAGAASPYDPNGRREPISRARSFHQVIA